MTIDFYKSRNADGDPIISLNDHEVKVVNDALKRTGAAFSLDPYGDTKLTDANVELTLSSISRTENLVIQSKLAKLECFEVCYAVGD